MFYGSGSSKLPDPLGDFERPLDLGCEERGHCMLCVQHKNDLEVTLGRDSIFQSYNVLEAFLVFYGSGSSKLPDPLGDFERPLDLGCEERGHCMLCLQHKNDLEVTLGRDSIFQSYNVLEFAILSFPPFPPPPPQFLTAPLGAVTFSSIITVTDFIV